MEMQFETNTCAKRIKSMLKVDFRRMFTTAFFYIMVGISFVVPILLLVMTTMMDGTVTINPQTGAETIMHGFDNVWQILGSVSGGSTGTDGAGMSMDLVSMCNINMLYFGIAVLVAVFICEDFRSGYAKNLFTVRAKKTDYVLSKTLVCFVGGACMLLAFVLGALIGGGVSSLPFTMDGFDASNLVACILSKIFLSSVFVGIFVLASVIAKQRTWLAIVLSLGIGMLFFTMVSMSTPLDAGALHVILTLVGGGLFSCGLGVISKIVLDKTSLV